MKGRIDHLAIDPQRRRLYVAALGNGTLEVVDLDAAKVTSSLGGLGECSGAAVSPECSRVLVSSATTGRVAVLDAAKLTSLGTVAGLEDADNVRYDAASQAIFVGFGEGGIARIAAANGQLAARSELPVHPEAFELEPGSGRMFVNLASRGTVAVVDRTTGATQATWTLGGAGRNYAMALDPTHHRLLVGCRSPSSLVVLNTDDGRVVARPSLGGDVDDVWYDAASRRIYASCGAGVISVLDQRDADHYPSRPDVTTRSGARTSLWAASTRRLYLAVPQQGRDTAEIRVYEAAP